MKSIRGFEHGATGAFRDAIGTLAARQTQQQILAEHEDNLAAAGFVVRPANTPERQAMLARLPRIIFCGG